VTTLPSDVRSAVEASLSDIAGNPVPIDAVCAVGGGCINPAVRVQVVDTAYFLKWNEETAGHLFATEAAGLEVLRTWGSLRIPAVVASGDRTAAKGWLLLEFIERGLEGSGYWADLGRGLAELHAGTAGAEHGGPDNFIGPLPQANEASTDWSDFWWQRRLKPQLERARSAGHLPGVDSEIARLNSMLSEILSPASEDRFSLLHGDLWSGNVFPDLLGNPVLVDPSTYRGHREVDLAMTELFGGFGNAFYQAYAETWPLLAGYQSRRRDAYQLYPLLVHLNLFGSSYEMAVRSAIRRLTR
jgi:fructosamine-3-kinase